MNIPLVPVPLAPLPVILRLPLARTSRAAPLKASFSHVTGRLCSIDVTCPKVNGVRDRFFSKAIKQSQALCDLGVGDRCLMGDTQVKEVCSLMHEYRDSIQEVVGTVQPPDGGFPYGDPCQDREEMACFDVFRVCPHDRSANRVVHSGSLCGVGGPGPGCSVCGTHVCDRCQSLSSSGWPHKRSGAQRPGQVRNTSIRGISLLRDNLLRFVSRLSPLEGLDLPLAVVSLWLLAHTSSTEAVIFFSFALLLLFS